MQTPHFELIYKLLMREATRPKKKQFQVNMFQAALRLLHSYLGVLDDISQSMSLSDRKNANILMGNMFRHDMTRILRLGFHWVNHEKVLSLLITTTHSFFKLLATYSEGKVLTIQTNKVLKRPKQSKKGWEQE